MHTDLISRLQNARTGIHIARAIGTDKALLPAINELLDVAREAEIALAEQPKPAEGGSVAWIRFLPDDGYEGPLHDRQMDDILRSSGKWTPLYAGAPPSSGQGEALASRLDRMADDRETIGYDCEAECLRSAAELVRQEERRLAGGEGE